MSLRERVAVAGVGAALIVACGAAVAGPAYGTTLAPQDTSNIPPTELAPAPDGVWFQGATPAWQGGVVRSTGRVAAGGRTLTLVDGTPGAAWTRLATGGPQAVWRLEGPRSGQTKATASLLSIDRPPSSSVSVPAAVSLGGAVPSASLAVDDEGRLWIGNSRGGLLELIGLERGAARQVRLGYRRSAKARATPLLLAAARAGRMWVADGRVLSVVSEDEVVRRIQLPFAAHAVAVDAARSLWVVGATGRIARVSPGGTVRVSKARVPGGRGGTIVAGPHRHLWLTVPGTNRLVELAPNGKTTVHRISSGHGTPAPAPRGLVAGGDGRLWVTTRDGLAVVDLDGRSVSPVPGVVDPATGCRFPGGARIEVHSADAAVATSWAGGGDDVTSRWVCLRADHQVRLLTRNVGQGDDYGPYLSSMLLQGTHLAYVSTSTSHYGDGTLSVGSLDLADPGSLRTVELGQLEAFGGGPPGEYAFGMLVLGPDGTAAWIDRLDTDRVQLLRPGATTPETVATAAWNTLANLAIGGSSVSWTENGEPRGAAL